jgi:hypothetical protein
MANAIWAGLGLAALLWPSRLAGPFDGAPLDFTFEALAAVAAVFAVWLHPRLLCAALTRTIIVALLAWQALISSTASMDGWCLRFMSPVALFRATAYVPHSWDVRADWQAPVPECSAIMRRSYNALEEFPVWFYNLPPVHEGTPAQASDRPPMVRLRMNARGYIDVRQEGILQFAVDEDVRLRLRVDDRDFTHEQAVAGIRLPAGLHQVTLFGDLQRSHWALRTLWNGNDLWRALSATTTPPTAIDRWLRPWARYVSMLLVIAFLVTAIAAVVARAQSPGTLAFAAACTAVVATLPFTGSPAATRVGALALFAPLLWRVPRRLQNGFGASLLVGLPFLAIYLALGVPQIGVFTWYSSGDDWWMFQRYGYRIFMEGYWLEGGQLTFWFQPLYRWINGALHMAFGDSSVGELWWDAACAGIGAFFAYVITRRFAGFRHGIAAAALTLAILVLGPGWYLFGRGLSELSSMGLIYAAALTAMRARRGHAGAMLATAVLGALAFYTRLNNLPMVCAIAVFAFPARTPITDVWRPSVWIRDARNPALLAVFGGVAIGMWLFTLRTWYYTNRLDMFFGTQAADRAVVKADDSLIAASRQAIDSIMMVLTMNDPPAFDVRSLPILFGVAAAIAGVIGISGLRRLPLNVCVLALAGLTSAVVARGSAYPGRFSLHLIPATVAIFVCAVSLVTNGRRPRSLPRAHQPPGTT